MLRHLLLLFYKQINVGQHKPMIEMNLGVDAIAFACFPNPVHCVLEICGVSLEASIDDFIEVEGLNTIEAFDALSGDADVTEMAKRVASCPAKTGCVILGTMQIKRIQALVFGAKDHETRQMEIEPNNWNEEELHATLAKKEADQNFEKLDIDIVDPGQC
jgi:hypothetical protein